MNAQKANLINAVSLFVMSLWDYYGSMNPTMLLLIPMLFGVMLLSLNNGVMYGIKGQTKAAFVLTLFITILLVQPLSDAINVEKFTPIFRTGSMMGTSLLALFYLMKSIKK